MKRLLNFIYKYPKQKKPKTDDIHPLTTNFNKLIRPSHIDNYIRNDALVDFLRLTTNPIISEHTSANTSHTINFNITQEHTFKRKIVNLIREKIGPTNIVTVSSFISKMYALKTAELIKQKIPVIHSAPFVGKNNIAGIASLLVRSDWIHKIINHPPVHTYNTDPTHYVVIEIIPHTLLLKSDATHLLNVGSNPVYKSHLYIYNQLLSEIQGYRSPHAYILGRQWKYTSKGQTHRGHNCFDKLACVDFFNVDINVATDTNNAINWIRELRTHAHTWTTIPPSKPELRPNMCVNSNHWNLTKLNIAQEIGDITMIWNCTPKHREKAMDEDIYNWRDKKLNANIMNITGTRGQIVDKILNINRQTTDKIRPATLQNKLNTTELEFFVDFETFTDIHIDIDTLPTTTPSNMIFLIGIGHVLNGKWHQVQFVADTNTKEAEKHIMRAFVEYLQYYGSNRRIYYWNADYRMWNTSKHAQYKLADRPTKLKILDRWDLVGWFDLCKYFKDEQIVIKNCFNFNLKNIAHALQSHNLIPPHDQSNCSNGLDAQILAWNTYTYNQTTVNIKNTEVMKDIMKYNANDCKILYDIVEYLKQNH